MLNVLIGFMRDVALIHTFPSSSDGFRGLSRVPQHLKNIAHI